MDLYTSHNDLADLLEARQIEGWHGGVMTLWDRKIHIFSDANFAYEQSLEEIEEVYWGHCFKRVERTVKRLDIKAQGSWISDGRFFRNIMAPEQMELYLPSFYQIVKLMPRQMLFARRKILTRYIEQELRAHSDGQIKWARWFVRSAPLLYPSHELVARANQFIANMISNADQTKPAQRARVVKHIQRIIRMSDSQLIEAFSHRDCYERELEWLLVLSRDFKITLKEIYAG